MGAGAAAGVKNAVVAAAAPELTAAVDGLPDDARADFWCAVAKRGVEAAISEANEDVKGAVAKLSDEDRATFCNAIAQVHNESPAGFLQRGFATVAEAHKEIIDTCFEDGCSGDEAMEAIVAKATEEFKTLATRSFKYHDKDDSNTLDAHETALLLSTLTDEVVAFDKVFAEINARTFLKNMVTERRSEMSTEEKTEMKRKLDEFVESNNKKHDEKIAQYRANKAERDKAAFKVCDTNGDGTLCLKEFLEVVMPEGALVNAFQAALGLREGDDDLESREDGDDGDNPDADP